MERGAAHLLAVIGGAWRCLGCLLATLCGRHKSEMEWPGERRKEKKQQQKKKGDGRGGRENGVRQQKGARKREHFTTRMDEKLKFALKDWKIGTDITPRVKRIDWKIGSDIHLEYTDIHHK